MFAYVGGYPLGEGPNQPRRTSGGRLPDVFLTNFPKSPYPLPLDQGTPSPSTRVPPTPIPHFGNPRARKD